MIDNISTDCIIYGDNSHRYFKMYNNITLEMCGTRIIGIITSDTDVYAQYKYLIGKRLINGTQL